MKKMPFLWLVIAALYLPLFVRADNKEEKKPPPSKVQYRAPHLLSCKMQSGVSTREFSLGSQVFFPAISELSSDPFLEETTAKLRLSNGLEVYLIQDMQQEPAAALAVKAGSWNDPIEFPGMAHFVEHLLFMGNRDFPDESAYSQFVLENLGQYNAYTFHDKTVYGFSVLSEHFEEILKRFAHLFIEPLFTPSSIAREMHAVSHEFDDTIENDTLRLWRVLKETGNAFHPNAVFSCGNLKSLSTISQNDIQNWFKKYYIASNMKLVIRSPYSLEEQKELVSKHFLQIENREVDCDPLSTGPITADRQKGHFTYITPSSKNRHLALAWEISKEFTDPSKKALEIVKNALDFEGPGSLKYTLEEMGLVSDIWINADKIEKDHILFIIEIDLTKEGLKNVHKVVETCFQAIQILKENKLPSYIFDTICPEKEENIFLDSSFDNIMNTAQEMVDEDFETFPEKTRYNEFDPQFIYNFCQTLTPSSCLFFLIADPKETGVSASAIEKWMGSPYFIRKIPDETIHHWTHVTTNPHLQIRPEIILTEDPFELFSQQPYDEDGYSRLLVEDDLSRLELRLAKEMGAKIGIELALASPYTDGSAENLFLGLIYCAKFEEMLQGAFPIEKQKKISLSWEINYDLRGISILLSVDKHFAKEVFQETFLLFNNVELTGENFAEYKELFADEYRISSYSLIQLADEFLEEFLHPGTGLPVDLLEKIDPIEYQHYHDFAKNFLSQLYLNGTIYGEIKPEEAKSLWEIILAQFQCKPFIKKEPVQKDSINLSSFQTPLYYHKKLPRLGNALLLAVEAGSATDEQQAAQAVLSTILMNEYFKELRTKQQIAYQLFAFPLPHKGKILELFAIQSSTHHPSELLYRTEKFLDQFSQNFAAIVSPDRVHAIKNTLLTKAKKYIEELNSDAEEIDLNEGAELHALQQRILGFQSLTYEDVATLANQRLSLKNKRRFAILIEGRQDYPQDNLIEKELGYRSISN